MKSIIVLAFLLISNAIFAQNKQGEVYEPLFTKIGLLEKEVVDNTSIRIYYALNAIDINDQESYIDLGMLQIGNKLSKYSSAFLAHSDSLLIDWRKTHPKAKTLPSHLDLSGREGGLWSEYQYSDFFVEDNKFTEWAVMPRFQEGECGRYVEPYPLMKWTLQEETETICGYKCQKAICHFRGRDFIAWFAPSIPIKKGPWKFGGLPGLIMKVYDKDHLYTFECVRVEKGRFPIVQYPEKYFPMRTRDNIYKLQVKINKNYADICGISSTWREDFYEYDPLELE